MSSYVDLWTTRRTYFYRCAYWKRDADATDLSAYVAGKKPDGVFWARERSPKGHNKQQVGDYLVDETTITLETQDRVNVASGDIIRFDGSLWNVLDVQENEIHKQRQYMHRGSTITYLRIKS